MGPSSTPLHDPDPRLGEAAKGEEGHKRVLAAPPDPLFGPVCRRGELLSCLDCGREKGHDLMFEPYSSHSGRSPHGPLSGQRGSFRRLRPNNLAGAEMRDKVATRRLPPTAMSLPEVLDISSLSWGDA